MLKSQELLQSAYIALYYISELLYGIHIKSTQVIASHDSHGIEIIVSLLLNETSSLSKDRVDLALRMKVLINIFESIYIHIYIYIYIYIYDL